MCGIVGFAGFDQPDLLNQMSAAVVHRGPDDDGAYRSHDHDATRNFPAVSLAARRLSIMDVAEGHQPMLSGAAVVTFNGEIYNHAELATELQAAGVNLRTRCDTEVLLRGYEVWGWDDLLRRLNGMFAFAIHDRTTGELRIARDRTGQKPLYYAVVGRQLLFASELKALLKSDRISRELNYPAVDRYLALRYVPQPETLIKGVMVLPGGHHLTWKNGEVTVASFWSPTIRPASTRSDGDLLEAFTELFDGAMRRTMRSDVPIGTYLSGGVDSSLITATLARLEGEGLPFSGDAFSLGFANLAGAENKVDETEQAAELAKHLQLKHTIYTMGADDWQDLPRALWHLERPIGEPLILAYYRLAQTAAKKVKVAFSGEGADELFAGYSFHRVLRWVEFYQQRMPSLIQRGCVLPILRAAPVAALNRLFPFPAYLGNAGKQRFLSFLERYSERDLGQNYAALRSLYDPSQRRELYAPAFRNQASEDWIHHAETSTDNTTNRPLERMLNLQYHDWLQDFALLRQDKLSMAHGLEVRLPMLDNTLIDFAATLPTRCKLAGRQNKVLLRRLASGRLPAKNARRKKQAFYFPLESFYRDAKFQKMVESTLNPTAVAQRGIFDPAAIRSLREQADSGEFLILKQLMALVMLELWMKMFIDGEELF